MAVNAVERKSRLRGALTSPRIGRRLTWFATAVLVAGVVAFIYTRYHNTAPKLQTQPTGPAIRQLGAKQPSVPITPQQWAVARAWILSAVARRNTGASWALTDPSFRAGYTRKQWASGSIPVVPFAVDPNVLTKYAVDFSHPREAQIEVALAPKAGTQGGIFFMILKARGYGKHKHWLVSYWVPRTSLPIPSTPH